MFSIDDKYKHANVPSTIRFTESMYKQLKEIAAKENISFNSLVLHCCSYALKNYQGKEKQEDIT